MAELALAIVGVSTVGYQLTRTLQRFGSSFVAARKQTRRISERIADYTTVLDLLAATLEDDLSICSGKAIGMLERLCEQTGDLFDEIEALLPQLRAGRNEDDLSFAEKVKWNFRRSKVELILGEVEIVKTSILLHLMTILLGRKIRSSRRRHGASKQARDSVFRVVEQQQVRAKNAIVQHLSATENFTKLQQAADAEDRTSNNDGRSATTGRAITLISPQNEVLTNFRSALLQLESLEQRQTYVVAQSPKLVHDLLLLWTNVNFDLQHPNDAPLEFTRKGPEDTDWNKKLDLRDLHRMPPTTPRGVPQGREALTSAEFTAAPMDNWRPESKRRREVVINPRSLEDTEPLRSRENKTKYVIVDPISDDDDRHTQVRHVENDLGRQRRHHLDPETVIRVPLRDEAEKMERPKLDKRSKPTREALSDRPNMRHSDSSTYDGSPYEVIPSFRRSQVMPTPRLDR